MLEKHISQGGLSNVSSQHTLPPRRVGRPAPPDVLAARERISDLRVDLESSDGVDVKESSPAGIRCIEYVPMGPVAGTMIWFHGGGYRMGSPVTGAPIGRWLASVCGVRVIFASYALAPEAPFPGALLDAMSVVDAVEDSVGPVMLGGDSAGGGIAAATTVARHGRGIEALLLLSPWLDLRVSSPSYTDNAASDAMFSLRSATEAAELYLQGHDPHDPLASPLLGAGPSFPPTCAIVGSGEVLLDDSVELASRLGRAGVDVELSVVAGMPHIGPIVEPGTPRASVVLARMAQFIDERTAASARRQARS
jgi:epsilon-lactone hydrolase